MLPREVHQLEVAGVAPARGSWEHMWCWPEGEVQQPEVAGSTEVQQPEVAGIAEVQQSEIAGGAAARGSCEPEVAGSYTKVQNPEVAGSEGKVQQLEVAEDSDFSDSEVQGGVCKPEEQSLYAVLVAEVAWLVAYGLESRAVSEPSWMAEHERQGHPYRKD